MGITTQIVENPIKQQWRKITKTKLGKILTTSTIL